MRKALLILIVSLFMVPALSGCLGGGDEVQTDEGDCPENICDTDKIEVGLGGIQGKVVDETLSPLAGANVTIRDIDGATTTTDSSGQFKFGNLEPGPYTVFAQMPGFQAGGKLVDVEADAVAEAGIKLLALPPVAEPYLEPREFNGFIGCGVSYWEVTSTDHCAQFDTNSKVSFEFPIAEGLTGLVICFDAEPPAQGSPPALRLKFNNPPEFSNDEYKITASTPHCEEPWEFNDDEDTWRDVQLPTPDETPATFDVRLVNPDLGGQPNYAYQMKFSVWMGLFYNGEPIPDGYDPRPDA